jgi:hypothetical protein
MVLMVVALTSASLGTQAQKAQEVEFSAGGCCPMCEADIVGALDVKGVKSCSWDQYNQRAVVVFKPGKVSLDELQRLVSLTGHDTDLHIASDEAYGELADCCKYRGENGCGNKHED